MSASQTEPGAPGNNGQISGITDSVDNGRSIGFSYDSLYRLISAATAGSSNYPAWALSETYDRYGNRTAQTVTQGTGPSNSITVSATTNQLVGSPYVYDASGDMTNDGVNTLAYDGEGRAVSASGSLGSGAYVYDGNGLRVEKCLPNCSNPSTSAAYIFSGSKVIAEYDAWTPGITPLTAEYVYSGSALLARVGSVDVRFTNDACCTGGDRNLFINSVTVGSTVIYPTDPSVSYTVPTCNGNGGLYCDGDLVTVSDAGRSATTITVNAWGSPNNNVYPHMQLLVGGVVVGEWDVTGTAQNYTVTLPTTAAHYYHQDHLSNRIVTDSSGSVVEQLGHFPFGESWYNGSSEKWFFTTYGRDSESGNDYAMARYHVSRLGRLSSPDPMAGSIADPQSLSRYTYSVNDPANITDPSGLCAVAQNQPKDTSQQSGDHGGPNANDANVDPGSGDGQGPNGGPCYQNLWNWLDGGSSLDGGDITDTSGAMDMGFSEGAGIIEGLLGKHDVGVEYNWEWNVDGFYFPTGSNYYTALDRAVGTGLRVLRSNNPCSSFFNNSPVVRLSQANQSGPLAALSSITAADFLRSDNFYPSSDLPRLVGAATTKGAELGSGSMIQVNSNPGGAFLSPISNVGPFPTGTTGAQTIMVLHELAHTLLLIPPDLTSSNQSLTNTQTILDNCLKAVKAALKGH